MQTVQVIINILLLFVGCIMECNAAILILTPILLPVVVQLGVNPIHWYHLLPCKYRFIPRSIRFNGFRKSAFCR